VLKAPDFPSVLVELGYLSNARDVADLRSADWRVKTANAMAVAIEGFFTPAERSQEAPSRPSEAVAASDKPASPPAAAIGPARGP
jgi:hypothetical protein